LWCLWRFDHAGFDSKSSFESAPDREIEWYTGRRSEGVIEFFSREIHAPDYDLLSMLTALGTQIAKFIERERMAEQLAQYTENR